MLTTTMMMMILSRGMYLTNAALMYLNYTTRIVAKSSKVIPTMLLGTLMQGRRWGRHAWSTSTFIVRHS